MAGDFMKLTASVVCATMLLCTALGGNGSNLRPEAFNAKEIGTHQEDVVHRAALLENPVGPASRTNHGPSLDKRIHRTKPSGTIVSAARDFPKRKTSQFHSAEKLPRKLFSAQNIRKSEHDSGSVFHGERTQFLPEDKYQQKRIHKRHVGNSAGKAVNKFHGSRTQFHKTAENFPQKRIHKRALEEIKSVSTTESSVKLPSAFPSAEDVSSSTGHSQYVTLTPLSERSTITYTSEAPHSNEPLRTSTLGTTPLSETTPESEPLETTEGEDPSPEPHTEGATSTEPEPTVGGTSVVPEFTTGGATAETETHSTVIYSKPTSEMASVEPPSKPEPNDVNPYAEPQPDWGVAKRKFSGAWGFHVYFAGIGFAILAVYSLASVIRLRRMKHLLSKGYFISLNALMFAMGVLRALFFFIDGYNSNKTFPPAISYLLYSIAFPCLTSAFSLLFLALLTATRVQLVSPKIQKPRTVIGMVSFHFLLSILTDILVGIFYSVRILMFLCQMFFVLWGLFLCFGYFYIFRKLYGAAVERQKLLSEQMQIKVGMQGSDPTEKPPKLMLGTAVKVTLITALLGVVCVALEIYGMVGIASIFSDQVPNPWAWWVFNMMLRLTEIGMCGTMAFVATQPLRSDKFDTESRPSMATFLCRCCLCKCKDQSNTMEDIAYNEIHYSTVNQSVLMADAPYPTTEVKYTNGMHANTDEMKPLQSNNSVVVPDNNSVEQTQVIGQHFQRRFEPLALGSPVKKRPASMLVNDAGFIRFRRNSEMSNDDVPCPVLTPSDAGQLDDIFATFPSCHGDSYHDSGIHESQNSTQDEDSNTDRGSVHSPFFCGVINRSFERGASESPPPDGTSLVPTDDALSDMGFRPPSSINLNASIDNELNMRAMIYRVRGSESSLPSPSGFSSDGSPNRSINQALKSPKFIMDKHLGLTPNPNYSKSFDGYSNLEALQQSQYSNMLPPSAPRGNYRRANSNIEPVVLDAHKSALNASRPSSKGRTHLHNEIHDICSAIGQLNETKK